MAAKVPAKWIRGKVDELAVREGCTFDEKAGQRVVTFLEKFCRQSKGQWAGRPLEVLDWQRDLILRLYGWKRPDGTRRFREAYVEVPKKNGKSTLVSGLTLYHLIADGEPGAEVYCNAYDLSQARIIFDEAEQMVRRSPDLARILEVIPSQKRIVHPASASKLLALSADVPSKDGVSSSFTVFDELHRQKTPAMWDIFRYAGSARRQPLRLSITTAGVDRQSICYQQHDYACKVRDGVIEDTEFLAVVYGAEKDDPIDDPATWRKANPSLGVLLREADFAREVKEAREKPTSLNNFLRLRLNVWTNAVERFLPREAWDACAATVDPDELLGRECYGGLDLASTIDLAAFALAFPVDGQVEVLVWAWIPSDNAERREEKDRVPYVTWAREGHVKLTDGSAIDYGVIREDIKAIAARYDLRKILIDRWNATQLANELREDGIEVEGIGQGFAGMSGPTKELERLVISGQLRHGDNPLLNWCADNAMAVRDDAGNVKLSKSKSREKIDALVAVVMSLAGLVAGEGEGGSSVYEERGIVFL